MIKGYYITRESYDSLKDKTIGVAKKISDQLDYFNSLKDVQCELLSFYPKASKLKRLSVYFTNTFYDEYLEKVAKVNFIYARHFFPITKSLISFFKKIKQSNSRCQIFYEIPTFPYDKEASSFKQKISLLIDVFYRRKLKKYIDHLLTFTVDKEIFGMKTLHIENGIDISRVGLAGHDEIKKDEIHLIAVANFNFWHGYDRLIEGLHNYYKIPRSKKVFIDFVGDDNAGYKALVDKYSLNEYVKLHGALFGKNLDNVFNNKDIAFSSLGDHRRNLFGITSALKSREYLARGLPIVTSIRIDIIPDDFKYCLRVPEDDSPIDIEKVVDFVTNLYSNNKRAAITKEIRSFAEKYCSMDYSMRSVAEYILNS
ncbi:MAG: hypothetical protein K6E69_00435 [Treponema sp.]|uniref:hypothetical protein n=1 Tax=Treponema sp. TaxID=166 RepID=UPI00298DFB8B|nr:hypothetical protein [Treponema sp.]MCR5385566.1 hypothetical protein [Treponema sp.]